VVSSKPAYYLPAILKNLGFPDYFSGAYGPDLMGSHDNKADLLASVLEELQADPSESVVIGDREQDVNAGRSNGTRTIAVTWGYGSKDELWKASPDYICRTPAEVAELVCGLD